MSPILNAREPLLIFRTFSSSWHLSALYSLTSMSSAALVFSSPILNNPPPLLPLQLFPTTMLFTPTKASKSSLTLIWYALTFGFACYLLLISLPARCLRSSARRHLFLFFLFQSLSSTPRPLPRTGTTDWLWSATVRCSLCLLVPKR